MPPDIEAALLELLKAMTKFFVAKTRKIEIENTKLG